MEPVKILYICQEIFPYVPESPVSVLCRQLPQFALENNSEVRIFMPCFGNINERRNQLHEVQRLSGLNLVIDEDDHQLLIKVASIQQARMQIYFIDNDTFFKRKFMDKDDKEETFADNDERMIFFIKGVLETVKKLRWTPDIIHCHGWMTSIAPLFVKTHYKSEPFYKKSKVIFSVYDDKFIGSIDKNLPKKLKIKEIESKKLLPQKIEWETLVNLAADYSDVVVTNKEDKNNKGMIEELRKKKVDVRQISDDPHSFYLNIYKEIL